MGGGKTGPFVVAVALAVIVCFGVALVLAYDVLPAREVVLGPVVVVLEDPSLFVCVLLSHEDAVKASYQLRGGTPGYSHARSDF